MVAMLLSIWLIYAWGGQAYMNVMNLVGLSASPQYLQKLTYLCWNHDQRILQIDTVRCAPLTYSDLSLSSIRRLHSCVNIQMHYTLGRGRLRSRLVNSGCG